MSERRAWSWDAREREGFDGSLDDELRAALVRGEIQLLFQPQARLVDEAVVGVEALARWRHPVRGELGAELLFTVAARSRFIVPLCAHVQREASCIAAGWSDARRELKLSINVTAQDLARADFADEFLAAVGQCRLSPRSLGIEVTESEQVIALDQAATTLEALRREGISVALDDFGAGYASLAYLSALPFDLLKLDKALIDDLTGNPRQRVVVESIVAMARRLGLATLAEGVETAAQRDLLSAAGCDLYQGFLCAPPLDDDALGEFLRRRVSPAPSTAATPR